MNDSSEEFLHALRAVVEELGAVVLTGGPIQPGDLPVEWNGELVAHVRAIELHSALDRLTGAVEREIGESLSDMSRAEKQLAVRRLDEQGAFLLRGAVDDIAQRMGVSRVTLYTYINALSSSRASAEAH